MVFDEKTLLKGSAVRGHQSASNRPAR